MKFYDTVSQFNENQTVLLDSRIMNYSLYRKIPEFVTVCGQTESGDPYEMHEKMMSR